MHLIGQARPGQRAARSWYAWSTKNSLQDDRPPSTFVFFYSARQAVTVAAVPPSSGTYMYFEVNKVHEVIGHTIAYAYTHLQICVNHVLQCSKLTCTSNLSQPLSYGYQLLSRVTSSSSCLLRTIFYIFSDVTIDDSKNHSHIVAKERTVP